MVLGATEMMEKFPRFNDDEVKPIPQRHRVQLRKGFGYSWSQQHEGKLLKGMVFTSLDLKWRKKWAKSGRDLRLMMDDTLELVSMSKDKNQCI